jgi:hypothetical protein
MPTPQDKRRRGRRNPEESPRTVDPETEGLRKIEREFFQAVIKDVAERIDENAVLLNVPVWGYPNHGKTTAILTALQACEPDLHGIALALVNDSDDLLALEAQEERYRSLGLPALANATREALSDLLEQFHSSFPDATELPSQYLLELQATPGRLGYVLLPDIKGGSYESVDEVARNATANAHAFVMVVDPEFYSGDNASALNYRKEVLRHIQRSANLKIPTCIMVTMSDKYGKTGDVADKTEKELKGRITQQRNPEVFKLLRVTAIGTTDGEPAGSLPPPKKRDPRKLVEAWTWTLHEALKRPRDEVLRAVPRTDLHIARRPKELETANQPELRLIGSDSDVPGDVIAAFSDNAHDRFLLFGEKKLFEVTIGSNAPKIEISDGIDLDTDFEADDLAAYSLEGTVFIGCRRGTEAIWHGPRGQPPIRMALPTPLHCWVPVGANRVVGLATNGTLYSLHRQGNQWAMLHYLPEFIKFNDDIVCSYQSATELVIAVDGKGQVCAITITKKGQFAERKTVSIALRYSSSQCQLNSTGYLAARQDDNVLIAGRETQIALGPCHPEWTPGFALATIEPIVAWATPEGRLRCARIDGKKGISTNELNSPLLDEAPTGLAWNDTGAILFATYPNGTCAWMRRFGF